MSQSINEKLDDAFKVVPLAQTDRRLNVKSEMTPIKSRLKVAKVKKFAEEAELSEFDKVIREFAGEAPPAPPPAPAPKMPAPKGAPAQAPAPAASPDDTAGLPELPGENDGLEDAVSDVVGKGDEGEEKGGGIPSGNNYSVEMAKQQLDGVIGNWMDLAGNYEEGEERHKFLEIGERLREISGVIARDYIQEKGPKDTMEPEGEMDLPTPADDASLSKDDLGAGAGPGTGPEGAGGPPMANKGTDNIL